MDDEVVLTTAPAARLAKCSEALIRQAEKDGRLQAERTLSGIRLFRLADVLAFAAAREQQARER